MANSILSSLKLTNATRDLDRDPVQQRRSKITQRIDEQIALARAQTEGGSFAPTKRRAYTDPQSGLRRSVEVPKRVKPWWFVTGTGKVALSVRYGARVLELAKGKFAIEVASQAEVVSTLEIIKNAVASGEFDALLERASKSLREGFGE